MLSTTVVGAPVELGPMEGTAQRRPAADMYGRLGPDSGGDPHVADLLQRTYTKLRDAEQSWRKLRHGLRSPVYAMPLPQMTTLYNHWLSSLLWQVALVFTDGVIVLNESLWPSRSGLSEAVYCAADALCDEAAARTRHTAAVHTQYTDNGRAPLSQMAGLPPLPNNLLTYVGVWDACNEIVDQVHDDQETLAELGVPTRMADIHAPLVKVIWTRVRAAVALRDDWESTTTPENRMGLTQELLGHTAEVFKAGQQLWAPYLADRFKEAVQKEKDLDELALGFDPWILTDPRRKAEAQGDPAMVRELVGFWESVNRDDVPALVGEVEAALRSGAVRRRVAHGYPAVPWQSQFLVVRPVTLGGVALQPCHLCTYYPTRKGGEVTVEIRRAGAVRNILELLGQTESSATTK